MKLITANKIEKIRIKTILKVVSTGLPGDTIEFINSPKKRGTINIRTKKETIPTITEVRIIELTYAPKFRGMSPFLKGAWRDRKSVV